MRCFCSVMYSQGALPSLPPRPPEISASHDTAITTGEVTFRSATLPPTTFHLDPRDFQRLYNDAASIDLSSLLQQLGSCPSPPSSNQTTFKNPSHLLPTSCRQQQLLAQQQQQQGSAASSLTSLPTFT